MTKMTDTKKERLGIKSPLQAQRGLTPPELIELQELIRVANAKNYEANQIRGNTALLNTTADPQRGVHLAEETEAIARILENAKNMYVSHVLQACGYEDGTKCSINLNTGAVVANESVDNLPPVEPPKV